MKIRSSIIFFLLLHFIFLSKTGVAFRTSLKNFDDDDNDYDGGGGVDFGDRDEDDGDDDDLNGGGVDLGDGDEDDGDDDDLNGGGEDLGDGEEGDDLDDGTDLDDVNDLDDGGSDDDDDDDEDQPIRPTPWDEEIDTRIINGFTPGINDNPFVLRLRVNFPDGTELCTGTLISANWALTVGHCAKGAESIEVQLGLYTRTQGPLQTIFVRGNNIIVHEDFVGTDTEIRNDIALLRLIPRANILSPRIRPIRFACERDGTFVGFRSRSCGWGIISDSGPATDTIQCVDMPIISNDVCRPSWPQLLLPSHMCASTIRNQTTCGGDSGGPLFVGDRLGRPQLVGLTSYGSNPCASTIPSVYTRITSYSSWITRRTFIICDVV